MDCQEAYATASLTLAIRDHNVHLLTRLLENGSQTDVPDNRGWYPMHEAAAGGSLKCAKVLMQHATQTGTSSHLNMLTHEHLSPLMLACGNGHEKVVNYLVCLKADNSLTSLEGATAAHAIFYWCHTLTSVSDAKALRMLQKVIPKGICAFTLMTNSRGCKILHHVIEMGLLKTFRFLLDKVGFSYEEPETYYGRTPIFLCAQFGRYNMMQVIIHKLGLRVWTPNETKVREAIRKRTPERVLRYRKPSKAALLDVGGGDAITPLCAAILKNNFAMSLLLLRYGANPLAGFYSLSYTWMGPLEICIYSGRPDLLKLVTDHIDMEQLALEVNKVAHNEPSTYHHPMLLVLHESMGNVEDLVSILAYHSAFMKVLDNNGTSILVHILHSRFNVLHPVFGRLQSVSERVLNNVTKILLEHGSSFTLNGVEHSPFTCSPFSNVIASHFIDADKRAEQCNLAPPLFTSPIKLSTSLHLQNLSLLSFFAMILHGADIHFNSTSDMQTFTMRSRHRLWKTKMVNYLHPHKKSIAHPNLGLLRNESREVVYDDEFDGPKSLQHLSRLAVRAALGRNLLMEPFPYPTLCNSTGSSGDYLDPMQHKPGEEELPSPIHSLPILDVLKGYLLLEDVANLFFCSSLYQEMLIGHENLVH